MAVPRICTTIHINVPRIFRMALHVAAQRCDIPSVWNFDLGLGFRVSCCDLST